MDTYLNLSQAADLLAELTSNPRIKDDIVRIIMLGSEGKIPIFWRNSLHIWTRIFSQVELLPRDELEPLPDTEASPNWLQIDHFVLCDLEVYQQAECWTFKIDNEDILNLMHRGEPLVTDLGLEMWVRHQVDYENVTIDRDQLFVVEHHLRKYAATLMPEKVVGVMPPEAAAVDQAQSQNLSWWQTEHKILDLAQEIGERLHDLNEKSQKKDRFATSKRKISVVIASRIKSIESNKAYPRDDCPSWETVRRHSLFGWKFAPE